MKYHYSDDGQIYTDYSAEGTYATVRIGRLIKWACVGVTVLFFGVFLVGWLIARVWR